MSDDSTPLQIRRLVDLDRPAVWQVLQPVLRAGATYALPCDMSESQALSYWCAPSHETFVALLGPDLAGTYYLRPNQQGGGSHVANCAFVTAAHFGRRGVAEAMARHALETARTRGFKAMQFNFVVSSNAAAVRLWHRLGFDIVGTLPRAFDHPELGLVDAFVMFRDL